MTLEESLKLVRRFKAVEPGKYAKKEIDRTPQFRFYTLTRLRTIHESHRQMCCWCNVQEVDRKLYKYCSSECEESSKLVNNTSDQGFRMYILIERQNCACAACGIVYEDELIRRILANNKANNTFVDHGIGKHRDVTYWQIGQSTGHLWHLDHIIPTSVGGHGTDLSNLQVLCVKCHKIKTSKEVSYERRNRK